MLGVEVFNKNGVCVLRRSVPCYEDEIVAANRLLHGIHISIEAGTFPATVHAAGRNYAKVWSNNPPRLVAYGKV